MEIGEKKIHFVGAGSGAKDLITVRGADRLKQADVVIYAGSLINPEVLEYCPHAEVYNSATMTLEEVIDVMRSSYEEGKTVVRLHTGEPSVYGAIREQMDALEELGIEYDLCPGVSACFGAAASLGLEYTLPGISQSLIITRMAGKTEVPELETIESFAAHKTSMAIYLSASMMEELESRLLKGGYSKDTPAAIVYKATWPEEESYICTVGTLGETSRKHNITRTAVILVGDVISKCGYEKSRLYDASFSTGYRKAKD
ncbi:MAG: precorrin-4 C(11)-methyltransferase [Eubacterium sp.]|nr:precorrin-4 C(11)-methyltransferase [Eubacterium sp.]